MLRQSTEFLEFERKMEELSEVVVKELQRQPKSPTEPGGAVSPASRQGIIERLRALWRGKRQ